MVSLKGLRKRSDDFNDLMESYRVDYDNPPDKKEVDITMEALEDLKWGIEAMLGFLYEIHNEF